MIEKAGEECVPEGVVVRLGEQTSYPNCFANSKNNEDKINHTTANTTTRTQKPQQKRKSYDTNAKATTQAQKP